ncbi:MAG: HAMP domain-containing histidine kinase [Oscillospiraceae bacterium]|jgi:signal transduction histidine kinase|nr:HAMP domain-containing histidine kinase [Oscillospiraceae bacterium]
MKTSLLKKYVAFASVILLLSFTILGFAVTAFMLQYFENEQKAVITKNSETFSAYCTKVMAYHNYRVQITEDELIQTVYDNFSESFDCDIFLTDASGGIMLYSSKGVEDKKYINTYLPRELISTIGLDNYYSHGNLNGFYKDDHLISISPVFNTQNGQRIIGYTATTIDYSSLYAMAYSVIRIYIFSAVIAFLLVFVIIVYSINRIVHPLKEIAGTARSFAKGSFTKKVSVYTSDEVGQLGTAFNELADYVISSENMRTSFIANVSHELKTPLTTIGGFIDGILDGTIPEADHKKYILIMYYEIKRLSRLVSSMLDLSRIDSGEVKIKLQKFNVTNLIIRTMLAFENKITDKKIDVKGLEDIPTIEVEGDSDLIHQVIYNLVENAVKFTNDGGYIQVLVTDTASNTSIEIINSGAGISPSDQKLIFDKFYKTDKSRNEDKIGMGLGLYIVKVIMQLHSGGITVSSVPNNYTSFKIWLPKQSTLPKD